MLQILGKNKPTVSWILQFTVFDKIQNFRDKANNIQKE